MKVVILRSNPIAPDPRVEKEARALAGAGYSVTALGWDRSAIMPERESRDTWEIVRLPIRAPFGKGLGNLPQVIRWQWGLFCWLVRHRLEYDLIHACDFDTVVPAYLVRICWRKKIVYDIFDFYADSLQRTPNWLKSALRRKELFFINRVDGVILADEARREQIAGTHPSRLVIVVNSPEDVVGPVSPVDFPPGSQLRLAYVGLLETRRGLLLILDVLRDHPDWTLELAGTGRDAQAILDVARSMPNVHWNGEVDYAKAIAINASADVLFATYDPEVPNHRYASPNKIFEAMMLGKPVIVARNTNADRLVEETGCGIIVSYGNRSDLEGALSGLAQDTRLRQQLGSNGRKAYDSKYSWEHMRTALITFYRGVAG